VAGRTTDLLWRFELLANLKARRQALLAKSVIDCSPLRVRQDWRGGRRVSAAKSSLGRAAWHKGPRRTFVGLLDAAERRLGRCPVLGRALLVRVVEYNKGAVVRGDLLIRRIFRDVEQ
jgi:hypothetical protein